MKIEQKKYSKDKGWENLRKDSGFTLDACNLVIVFGSTEILGDAAIYDFIRRSYAKATIVMNSTSGEIVDTFVNDNTISLTAISFEKTKCRTAITHINESNNSFEAGAKLGKQFDQKELTNVLVISDGQKVNGSEL